MPSDNCQQRRLANEGREDPQKPSLLFKNRVFTILNTSDDDVHLEGPSSLITDFISRPDSEKIAYASLFCYALLFQMKLTRAFLCTCIWLIVQGFHQSIAIRDKSTRSLSSSVIRHKVLYGEEQLSGNGDAGISITSTKARIADVRPVSRERFPYTCSLRRHGSEEHVCVGVLIDEQWILTTAHCLWNKEKNGLSHDAHVRCGIHEIDTDDPANLYQSKRAYWPHEWDGDFEHGFDIGLVRLDRKAWFEKPQIDRIEQRLLSSNLLAATGWDSKEQNSTANVSPFPATSLSFLSLSACEAKYENRLRDYVVCTESIGMDAYHGDSGGPLVIPHIPKGGLSQGLPHRDLLVGITSFHPDARNTESPIVYTRVSAFWKWIDETIRRETAILDALDEERKEDFVAFVDGNDKTPRDQQELDITEVNEMDENLMIEDLLDSGLLIKAPHDDFIKDASWDSTMLHREAISDTLDSVELLIDGGVNIAAVNKNGKSPLHHAALNGDLDATEILLDHKADNSAVDVDGHYPLHSADQRGHLPIVEMMISIGTDINARALNNDTPLHPAVVNKHDTVEKILLLSEADVDAAEENNWTSLHHAARAGLLKIVTALLDHEAKVDVASHDGWTPLHYAARYGFDNIAKELLKHGEDGNAINGDKRTPLHLAARYGQNQVVQVLLDKGVDVSVGNNKGWTALHIASRHGHANIVQRLLNDGADVDAVNDEESTPLHEASRHGQDAIVRILLDRGAQVNVTDNEGWNALHQASRHGHNEIVRDLLIHQADVSSANDKGWTALHMASRHGHAESVNSLLDHGADVHAVEEDGWTSLHLASHAGHYRIAQDLVAVGASKTSRTKTGEYPWNLICTTKHSHCSKEMHSALVHLLTP